MPLTLDQIVDAIVEGVDEQTKQEIKDKVSVSLAEFVQEILAPVKTTFEACDRNFREIDERLKKLEHAAGKY